MSGTQTRGEHASLNPTAGTVDMKLEVVVIPVSDVERAKRFYGGLGWRLDADIARADLIRHGVDVSEAFHFSGTRERVRGPDPEGRSYSTFAAFSDPDGNSWLLQEIKTRLPGRVWSGSTHGSDVATLMELLREAEKRHGEYEPTAPKHHRSGWYAAFISAREQGRTSDQAAKDAALHMEHAGG
jgi:catechol 2,3-dioxygenase-like lactoylglutathione lyase family enzyme